MDSRHSRLPTIIFDIDIQKPGKGRSFVVVEISHLQRPNFKHPWGGVCQLPGLLQCRKTKILVLMVCNWNRYLATRNWLVEIAWFQGGRVKQPTFKLFVVLWDLFCIKSQQHIRDACRILCLSPVYIEWLDYIELGHRNPGALRLPWRSLPRFQTFPKSTASTGWGKVTFWSMIFHRCQESWKIQFYGNLKGFPWKK